MADVGGWNRFDQRHCKKKKVGLREEVVITQVKLKASGLTFDCLEAQDPILSSTAF